MKFVKGIPSLPFRPGASTLTPALKLGKGMGLQVLLVEPKGNPVEIGDGPAAVTGDKGRTKSLSMFYGWEDAV